MAVSFARCIRLTCLNPSAAAPLLIRVQGYASIKEGEAHNASKAVEGVDRAKVWWRPDPSTGMWVPEDQEPGSVKSTKVPQQRVRTVQMASLDEKKYWNSLEEMPERHYY